MQQEPRPITEYPADQLEVLLSDAQMCVEELQKMDPAQLSEPQRQEREETLVQGYDILNAIQLELIRRQVEELKAGAAAFIERMKRAAAAIKELTQRWGYRDITALVRAEYEQQGKPLTDPDTKEPPRFLCVLQTPGSDIVYCFKTVCLFDELDKAQASGQEYPQGCPAPDPADPTVLSALCS